MFSFGFSFVQFYLSNPSLSFLLLQAIIILMCTDTALEKFPLPLDIPV